MRSIVRRTRLAAASALALAAVGAILPAAASAEVLQGYNSHGIYYICVDTSTETVGHATVTNYTCYHEDGTITHIAIGRGLPI